jgi:hypothetical protein
MPVGPPAAAADVHFHVARHRRVAIELHHRTAKVRSALMAPETGMKNPDGLSVQHFQMAALQPLMLPDGLEQPLGRRSAVVVQRPGDAPLRPPLRVEIVREKEHSHCFCARGFAMSSRDHWSHVACNKKTCRT